MRRQVGFRRHRVLKGNQTMKIQIVYCALLGLALVGTGCIYLTDDDGYDDSQPVGACGDYQEFEGVCTGTGDDTFSFEGVIDGETIVNTGNTLSPSLTLEEGESVTCWFRWAVSGACTPCLFDIGGCGQEAWDDYRDGALD